MALERFAVGLMHLTRPPSDALTLPSPRGRGVRTGRCRPRTDASASTSAQSALRLDLDRRQADGVAERAVAVEGRQAGRVVDPVPADHQAVGSGW
jgi:hypothetical protein